ncbi:MAG: type III secretion chaperone [Chlamydia sp.]
MRDWKEELDCSEDQMEEMRHIGYSYIRQGKYSIALSFFHALSILDPEGVYDLQTLGALYVELDQPQLAIQSLNRALQLDGEHGPTLLNLMKAFFMCHRTEDGLRLARILQHDQDSFIASSAKALALCYSF